MISVEEVVFEAVFEGEEYSKGMSGVVVPLEELGCILPFLDFSVSVRFLFVGGGGVGVFGHGGEGFAG